MLLASLATPSPWSHVPTPPSVTNIRYTVCIYMGVSFLLVYRVDSGMMCVYSLNTFLILRFNLLVSHAFQGKNSPLHTVPCINNIVWWYFWINRWIHNSPVNFFPRVIEAYTTERLYKDMSNPLWCSKSSFKRASIANFYTLSN